MSVRSQMVMRATIERNFAPDDEYGQPGPPAWQIIANDVPCRVWYARGASRRTEVKDKQTITVEQPGGIMPLSTDVNEKDRVRQVTDRQGKVLFNVLYIDAVMRRIDHWSIRFKGYGSGT